MVKSLIFLLALFIFLNQPDFKEAATIALIHKNGYTELYSVEGAGLYRKTVVIDGNAVMVYLQLIDMSKFKLTQIYAQSTNKALQKGKYIAKIASPYFYMISLEEVISYFIKKEVPIFSILNCSFFESYADSTQLSFPIKSNGKLITGGSSRYGPTVNAISNYYAHVQLYAFTTDRQGFNITKYNPVNNYPLTVKNVKEGIVTYRYQDHPALIIGTNQPNRYTLLGELPLPDNHGKSLLAIITVDKTTIIKAAELLQQTGVKGTILTVDGGTSASLYNAKTGTVEQPGKLSNGIRTFTRLPHYLAFIKK